MTGQENTIEANHETEDERVHDFVHLLCDHPRCGKVITMALSDTLEKALARSRTVTAIRNWRRGVRPVSSERVYDYRDMLDSEASRALLAAANVLGWQQVKANDDPISRDGVMTFCADHIRR